MPRTVNRNVSRVQKEREIVDGILPEQPGDPDTPDWNMIWLPRHSQSVGLF